MCMYVFIQYEADKVFIVIGLTASATSKVRTLQVKTTEGMVSIKVTNCKLNFST